MSNGLRPSSKVTYGSKAQWCSLPWFDLHNYSLELNVLQFYVLHNLHISYNFAKLPSGFIRSYDAQGSGNYSTCALIELGKVGHICQSQFANHVQVTFKWRVSSPMFPTGILSFETSNRAPVQSADETLLLDRTI